MTTIETEFKPESNVDAINETIAAPIAAVAEPPTVEVPVIAPTSDAQLTATAV